MAANAEGVKEEVEEFKSVVPLMQVRCTALHSTAQRVQSAYTLSWGQ